MFFFLNKITEHSKDSYSLLISIEKAAEMRRGAACKNCHFRANVWWLPPSDVSHVWAFFAWAHPHSCSDVSISTLFLCPPSPPPSFPIIHMLKCIYNRNYIQLNDSENIYIFSDYEMTGWIIFLSDKWNQPLHLPHTSEVQHQPSLRVDSPSHGCPMLLWGWSIRCVYPMLPHGFMKYNDIYWISTEIANQIIIAVGFLKPLRCTRTFCT